MSTFGQKLRLNVCAIISEATVGRLLVCIDDEALVEDLASKLRGALARSSIEGHLLRLTNRLGANLPSDEKVGDVLRDAEEVIAVLTAEPEDPAVRRQLAGGIGEIMSFARAPNAQDDGGVGLMPGLGLVGQYVPPAADEGPYDPYLDQPAACNGLAPSGGSRRAAPNNIEERNRIVMDSAHSGHIVQHQRPPPPIPGPAETFEEDLLELPAMKGAASAGPTRLPYGSDVPVGSDWSVEGLSPKLREYISTRFREAHTSACEPNNTFIAVTMRPWARAGAVPSQPIHYSIARIDVVEFERLCAHKILETRSRVDYFQRCQQTLRALLDKGVHATDYVSNMLPYRFRVGEEFSDLLSEADGPTFGQVEGFRPTIVIDNSGAVGESLTFIRTALKRILYSFLVAKSKFNLVKFSPQGNPVAWANGMVPPTAQVLREAEEFLDGMRPVRHGHSASLLEGVQLALAHPEADVVYVLTSGLPRRCSLDVALRTLRSMNIRDLPLHIVGVECEPKAELELRRIAEDNHGSFRHKRFGPGRDSLSSSLSSSGALDALGKEDTDSRLTISGQMSILEIMLEEQEMATVDWLEEQKCANRLLLTTASQQPVPDAEQARAMYQRAAIGEFKRQHGESESRLQQLVDAHVGRIPAAAAGYLGAGRERQRVAARGAHRASSQPHSSVSSTRRPSVVNPWDRPGATIKASQLAGKFRGPGPLPPPGGRPPSARSRASRPISASGVRSDSARRRDL